MTFKKIIFFLLIVQISCTRTTNDSSDTFIVPIDTMPRFNATDSNVPTPPRPNRAYYLPCNFIIDTAGQLFYYQQARLINDDFEVPWNTPPIFINLQPKDIVQIPNNQVEDFINLNILSLDRQSKFVAIASAQDTIKSEGLFKIIEALKTNNISWKFRRATQEETIVLDYKKRQKSYFSDEIKWDSTKIRFK